MRWVQHYLGPGSLVLRWVASGQAWVAGLGLGSWLNSWWHGFHWLLSRRHLGATRSSCRAGVHRQVVLHCLGQLMCSCEALKRRGRLSSRWIGSSSESWSRPSRLWRVGSLCLPANVRGRAEMHGQRCTSRPSRERSGSPAMAHPTAKASSLVEQRSCRWRRRILRYLGSALHKRMAVQLLCVVKKAFSIWEKYFTLAS